MSPTVVRRAVTVVLDGEGAGPAEIDVVFVSGAKMRGLNRRTFGRDRSTDVLAFQFAHPGRVVGAIYICPTTARRQLDPEVSEREEISRLIVHGTLHVLGHDHPRGANRTRSAMWRRQERYIRQLEGVGR